MRLTEQLRPVSRRLFGGRGRVAVWVILTAALASVTASGAFGAATPPSVPRVPAGEAVDVGQARLSVRAWTIRHDIETEALAGIEGAAGWLVVDGEVRATTEATTTFPAAALDLPDELRVDPDQNDPDQNDPDRVILVRDGTIGPDLQPGLAERVLLLWPVPLTDPESDDLDLAYVHSVRSKSTLDSGQIWRIAGTVAITTVPRDDEVGDALIEDDEPWGSSDEGQD